MSQDLALEITRLWRKQHIWKSEQTGNSNRIFYSFNLTEWRITLSSWIGNQKSLTEEKHMAFGLQPLADTFPFSHAPPPTHINRKRRTGHAPNWIGKLFCAQVRSAHACVFIVKPFPFRDCTCAHACIMLFIPETRGCLIKIRDKCAASAREVSQR
jgi:hypothetical protein